MKLFKKLVVMIALIPMLANAQGDSKGNGGDILVCNEDLAGETSQFYDVYEAPFNQYTPNIDSGLTFKKTLGKLLERISRIDPERYKGFFFRQGGEFIEDINKIYALTAGFESVVALKALSPEKMDLLVRRINSQLTVTKVDPKDFKDLPDEGIVSYPNYCKIKQLYIQFPKKDYLGHWQLFNVSLPQFIRIRASAVDLAVSVTHELYYRETAEKRYTDSRYARELNEMILADRSLEDYVRKILLADSKSYEFNRIGMGYYQRTFLTSYKIANLSTAGSYFKLNIEGALAYCSKADLIIEKDSLKAIGVACNVRYYSKDARKLRRQASFVPGTLYFRMAELSRSISSRLRFEVQGPDSVWFSPRNTVYNNIFILDMNENLRYSVEPNIRKIKFKGKKIPDEQAVMEFDGKGNLVSSGLEANVEPIVEKLFNEVKSQAKTE